MKCFGCQRELEVGDHYIEDSASGFCETQANPVVDGLVAELVTLCQRASLPAK